MALFAPYEPKVFQLDITNPNPEWLTHLTRNGWAAVQVLTEAEAEKKFEQMWAWILERFPGVKRGDPETYGYDTWPDNIKGILKSYGAGQAEFMWEARTHPNVLDLFSRIYGTRDLLSSFDGFGLYPKGFVIPLGKRWGHRDQNPKDNTFRCYQGVLTVTDPAPNAGGLVLWPETLHTDFSKEYDVSKVTGNWFSIPTDFQLGTGKLIRVPKGTIVLWDSRIAHQNTPGLDVEFPDRAVLYISMQPKRSVTKHHLEKRQKYYETGRTTSHWSSKGMRVNPDTVMFRSKYKTDPKKVLENYEPVRGPKEVEIRKLVGY